MLRKLLLLKYARKKEINRSTMQLEVSEGEVHAANRVAYLRHCRSYSSNLAGEEPPEPIRPVQRRRRRAKRRPALWNIERIDYEPIHSIHR